MEQKFEYFAFISYKREDEKWAVWLQHKLETFKLPTVIAKSSASNLPQRLKPVFKDTTDIKPGVLAEVLSQNLEKSKYLIVVCSPRSARSPWVGKEISDFITLGKSKNIILFIVDGYPYSDDPVTECYHPVIKEKLPEMLGVNIHEEGKESNSAKKQKAFIRVVSTLLDVSFDSLWQRQKRRIIRKWILRIAGALLFLLILTGVSRYQYKVNQPFDACILFKERTPYNPELPFKNGRILLCFDNDTLGSKPIDNDSGIVGFRNIPGRFLGKEAHVRFDMFGYETLDTIVRLDTRILVSIARDNAFGKIQGYVRDDLTDHYLPGIVVEIEDLQAVTDSGGFFQMNVPLERQKTSYPVVIRKDTHVVRGQTGYPAKNEETLMNTLYFR